MSAPSFEIVMSNLTVAIGNVERLQSISPEQFDRLVQQRQRMIHAVASLYVFEADNEDATDPGATLGVVGSLA